MQLTVLQCRINQSCSFLEKRNQKIMRECALERTYFFPTAPTSQLSIQKQLKNSIRRLSSMIVLFFNNAFAISFAPALPILLNAMRGSQPGITEVKVSKTLILRQSSSYRFCTTIANSVFAYAAQSIINQKAYYTEVQFNKTRVYCQSICYFLCTFVVNFISYQYSLSYKQYRGLIQQGQCWWSKRSLFLLHYQHQLSQFLFLLQCNVYRDLNESECGSLPTRLLSLQFR
eukprot:TRINITY_DN71786_c0_g1_i1.p1 TRINITY_DN71786_c0_g1~~TRINITY_DN71786_c0_g1_i1.p1  ORF type:complete len:254 (+),score=-52.60 TRINITY_DN71786_c0_g1_i1:73-762(+)